MKKRKWKVEGGKNSSSPSAPQDDRNIQDDILCCRISKSGVGGRSFSRMDNLALARLFLGKVF